ncbi:MAG: sensor domain-containing diguanylate cyclase [Firmicutes bacterium]|nr:sensor domain-containing diguanylate cyclase [Bacillota bacterium]
MTKKIKEKYLAIIVLISLILIFPKFLNSYTNLNNYIIISIEIILALILGFVIYKWFLIPFLKITKCISENSVTKVDDYNENKRKSVPYETLENVFSDYKKNDQRHRRLLHELKQKNKLLNRNNKITNAIMDITSEILTSVDINRILQMILEKAINIIPKANKGSILILEDGEISFKAVYGYDFNVLKNLKLKKEELFQYSLNQLFDPIIINDLRKFNKETLNKEQFQMLEKADGYEQESILSCGIALDGKFIGVISIDNTLHKNAFTNEDKLIIKHLAEQIGIAIKNTKLVGKITYLSRHDALTGAFNRHEFQRLFKKAHEEYIENNNIFSLVVFDMNDLKIINDTYGHDIGDKIIKEFANTVKEKIGEENIFARIGGDEFTALIYNKNKEEVLNIINNIKQDLLKKPLIIEEKNIYITFGYGIVESFEEHKDIDKIFQKADSRMYKDKRKVKKLNRL